jgi:release factor glutamine methyltransferase
VVADQARAWAEERAQGKVLQHLTGEQAFLEHVYEVSNEVLIPRPETEGLVILALELLSAEVARNQKIQLGFEVGLGSGVVSIELLQARPDLQMVASEVSAGARAVAMRNLARVLRTERAQPSGALPLEILAPTSPEEVLAPFEQWVHLYGRKADFFISNPPYLARSESGSEVSETDSEVREQEPALALFPSEALGDPLAFYRIFSEGLAGCLRPEGWLIVELADERARETAQLFELVSTRAGTACWDEVHLHPDLTGKLRYLSARRAK